MISKLNTVKGIAEYGRSCRKRQYRLSEKLTPQAAQQLLCACITADMRSHNTCCACVDQLMGAYSKPTLLAQMVLSICFVKTYNRIFDIDYYTIQRQKQSYYALHLPYYLFFYKRKIYSCTTITPIVVQLQSYGCTTIAPIVVQPQSYGRTTIGHLAVQLKNHCKSRLPTIT